jgi:predicted nuclease with TOPRIM domain
MLKDMFDLSDKLRQLREEKQALDERLKDCNAQIEDTEYRLSEMMAESETQNFTRSGMMFYLTTKTRASAMPELKDDLYAALKAQGFGDLVTETVNHNSLSSFVKEQIEENGDALPGWLAGLVTVFDKTTVGVRKAAK